MSATNTKPPYTLQQQIDFVLTNQHSLQEQMRKGNMAAGNQWAKMEAIRQSLLMLQKLTGQ